MILPDIVEPNLRIVFCGTAAGARSAELGAYYAGAGNLFWPTLHEIGLTPRVLEPREASLLPEWGVGLTDLCKVSSGSDAEVGTERFDVDRLTALLERYRPGFVAFNGKNAARGALGIKPDYGEQSLRLSGVRVFVLPSTSGLARRFWNVQYWKQLADCA